MSIQIDVNESNETADSEPLLLVVSQKHGAIIVEVVNRENRQEVYEQQTVWLDTLSIQVDSTAESRMSTAEKQFNSMVKSLEISVSKHPDGVLVEVVVEDTVVCFYRIRYVDWGLVTDSAISFA